MKSIFTDKQLEEMQFSYQKAEELKTLLSSLLEQAANKEIETKTSKADATLKGVITYLQDELRKYMTISTEYQAITARYQAEKARICHDLDDDFITKPETLEAIAKLDEEYYAKNVARENGIEEEAPKFSSI